MNRMWSLYFGWVFLMITFTCIKVWIFPTAYVSAQTEMNVEVVHSDYHSYTIALSQIQDYYVECDGKNLINITPLDDPIILDKVYNLCYE